jgi:hypothetical protein
MRKSIVLLACAGLLALTASAASARTGPVSRVPSAPRANPAAVMPADQATVQAIQAPVPDDGFCLRLRRTENTTTYLCLLRVRPAEPGVGRCQRHITVPVGPVSLMTCRDGD